LRGGIGIRLVIVIADTTNPHIRSRILDGHDFRLVSTSHH